MSLLYIVTEYRQGRSIKVGGERPVSLWCTAATANFTGMLLRICVVLVHFRSVVGEGQTRGSRKPVDLLKAGRKYM